MSFCFGCRYAVNTDAGGAVTGLTLVVNGARLLTYEGAAGGTARRPVE